MKVLGPALLAGLLLFLVVSFPRSAPRPMTALQLQSAFPAPTARASDEPSPGRGTGAPNRALGPLQRHQHEPDPTLKPPAGTPRFTGTRVTGQVESPRPAASMRVGSEPSGLINPSQPVRLRHPLPTPSTRPNAAFSGVQGLASWYDAGSGIYGAMPGYVDGTRVVVRVCGTAGCVDVRIVTQCQCYVHTSQAKIIDLSPAAFRLFAPLSAGQVRVTVTRLP